MKERAKGLHSGLLKQTSRSLHEHLAAFCINMFYKPYSVLRFVIGNGIFIL